MKESNRCYVSPRTEVYTLENESFIAGSSTTDRQIVDFGNSNSNGGWTIQKGGSSSQEETL